MRNTLTIETPESVGFTYQVADVGSRFLAIFIDTLIQFGAIVGLGIALDRLEESGIFERLPRFVNADQAAVVVIVTSFLLYVGYFAAFEMLWHGQTPGKRAVRLRVIREDGYPLGPLDVLLRNLVRLVDFFPAFYGLGVVVMLLNHRARRLGDIAAGTLVVRMRGPIKLDDLAATAAATAAAPDGPGVRDGPIDLARDAARRLSAEDAHLIEDYLARRAGLANAAELDARLRDALEARLASPALEAAVVGMADQDFLALVLRAYRLGTGAS